MRFTKAESHCCCWEGWDYSRSISIISPASTQLSLSLCVHHSGRLTADTLDNAIEESWLSEPELIFNFHRILPCILWRLSMNMLYEVSSSYDGKLILLNHALCFFISSHKFDPDRKTEKKNWWSLFNFFSPLMLNDENMISYDNFRSLFGWALLSEKKLAHWKIRKSSHFPRQFDSLLHKMRYTEKMLNQRKNSPKARCFFTSRRESNANETQNRDEQKEKKKHF